MLQGNFSSPFPLPRCVHAYTHNANISFCTTRKMRVAKNWNNQSPNLWSVIYSITPNASSLHRYNFLENKIIRMVIWTSLVTNPLAQRIFELWTKLRNLVITHKISCYVHTRTCADVDRIFVIRSFQNLIKVQDHWGHLGLQRWTIPHSTYVRPLT